MNKLPQATIIVLLSIFLVNPANAAEELKRLPAELLEEGLMTTPIEPIQTEGLSEDNKEVEPVHIEEKSEDQTSEQTQALEDKKDEVISGENKEVKKEEKKENNEENPYYSIGFSTGGSFALKPKLNVDTSVWDPSPEGYNSRLSDTYFFGANLRYDTGPKMAFSFEYTKKGDSKYRKYQTSELGIAGSIGDKTRFFKLQNETFMVNALIKAPAISERLIFHLYGHKVVPYIGAGLGMAINYLSDFHSITSAGVSTSIMNGNTSRNLAYQFIIGAESEVTKNISLGVAYRFLNAGRFESNNYIYGPQNLGFIPVPAWNAILKTQEIVFSIRLHLND